jgi:hypothetical protein
MQKNIIFSAMLSKSFEKSYNIFNMVIQQKKIYVCNKLYFLSSSEFLSCAALCCCCSIFPYNSPALALAFFVALVFHLQQSDDTWAS